MEENWRRARLLRPWRGYYEIEVDMNSYTGGPGGCQYNCRIMSSGAEIQCHEDEFELY